MIRHPLLLLLCLLVLVPGAVRAQSDHLVGLSWSPGVPLGDLSDFTADATWRGVAVDLRGFRGARATVGLRLGWTAFREEVSGVVAVPGRDSTLTGAATVQANAFPLHLTAHLYTGRPSHARLAVGVGLGVYALNRRVDAGTFRAGETTWHPGGYPEIALLVPLRSLTLQVGARYHYGFGLSDDPSVSWVGLDVGILDF